ncbi:MAG TPA: GntR family transcriptional regulator [Castellaniella sp.]|nr:GntR family transcriptional regulator [Castellaniella sp.]
MIQAPVEIRPADRSDASHDRPLSDAVYERLVTELISLELAPGARLSVDALARHYGVSQTPIRAALIRLETEGLVVRKHNAGFWAAPLPSGQQFSEINVLRRLLEPEAAAQAAENARGEDVRRLNDLCVAMEQLVHEGAQENYGRFALLDGKFHNDIASLSGNETLRHILGTLHAHMHLFRLHHHASVAEDALAEHRLVLDGIRTRDTHAARVAMEKHIAAANGRMEVYYHRTN